MCRKPVFADDQRTLLHGRDAVEQVVKYGRGRKRGATPTGLSKQNGWLKRQAARLRRRLERVDPENVPRRVTRGWGD